MAHHPPRLPSPVQRKLYKTGQSRGATLSEIYQNRVLRNNTVLIPFRMRDRCQPPDGEMFENGSITLVRPSEFFENKDEFDASGLVLGRDALVFYELRPDWERWSPGKQGWRVPTSRTGNLGGQFVARIPGTTASGTPPIREGFTSTENRGAGIRVYEYASAATIEAARLQLEALMWKCEDSLAALGVEMGEDAARQRAEEKLDEADRAGLLDQERLTTHRAIDEGGYTICPLCRDRMSAETFAVKIRQTEGREKVDTTVTETSLFHISELRVGEYGHHPYNVGWGHHHCNVVAKDAGIAATLEWLRNVLERNERFA